MTLGWSAGDAVEATYDPCVSKRPVPAPVAGDARPAISVVVPFSGSPQDARATLAYLAQLRLRPGDEVVVADNSEDGVVETSSTTAGVTVVRATYEQSSYYARNRGAEETRNDWLLFMDADCRPAPTLLDDYFSPAPGPACGVVAGGVVSDPSQQGLVPRWARSRRHLSEEHHVFAGPPCPHPAGITPNLLLRREAWESLGGFHEGIRSGGDVEICWRAQDCGWAFEHRPDAKVEHIYASGLAALARQASRHNAGRLWVRRRYRNAFPRPRLLGPLARCLAGAPIWALRAQFGRALFKLVDAVSICGSWYGWYLGSNKARPEITTTDSGRPSPRPPLLVMTDAFPARSETFVYNEVRGLIACGVPVRVESSVRPVRTERAVAREMQISYLEDDPPRRKLADVTWLWMRHPIRCIRDRLACRRWAADEPWGLAAIAPAARRLARRAETHVHVHFAAGASLHALRLSRLLGIQYSLTAHAYDIFQRPRNLPEKITRASFVAAECHYTVQHLRSLADGGPPVRIHRVVTGVDAARFRRVRPYPGGGRVLAVGRHVEKKGFSNLVRAASLLRAHPVFEEVVIVGEGPLRPELERLVEMLDLGGIVRFKGNVWGADGIARILEVADVLAIPAVVASDGDRDALPVISYEALAMEVPIVASDLVGLPEVVRPPWGRLVGPGDPEALAAALSELLGLSPAERAAMGAAGRQFVLEYGNPQREVERLSELITAAAISSPRRPL